MNDATEVFQPLQADDPPTVAGYRLAARLGAGGMGRVYLSHTQGGRPVAIKVVRPELADDAEFRRRFRREIAAARRVRGAYTAELIDADAEGTPPWLATLYVPGPSLTEAVGRRGPLPVPAVLWLMAGVAEALQAIHDTGIVHRDLKPSNVLLAADGPRVIDFGISLASDATSYTATGATIGTPSFMAPEQATAGEVTAATDIFALGQTAAFAALGEPLYGNGSAVNMLYRIVHSEPDLSLLPEELRPLFARCLVAEPKERATPADVVAWCRKQLGPDADPGAGTAVWREFMGPAVTVPAPVPAPTLVAPYTEPLVPPTRPMWPQPSPLPPEERRARRRTALIMAAAMATAVAVGAALLVGAVWRLTNAVEGFRHRGTVTSSTTTGPATSATRSSEASGSASPSEKDGRVPGAAPLVPPTPTPLAYAMRSLDESDSVSLEEPVQRKDRKGDIRFDCKEVDCALNSDTSTFVMIFGPPGTTYDDCRLLLHKPGSHRLELAAAAAGTEICAKDSSGNIALLVIQVKSTALWYRKGLSFVDVDMTVWPAAERARAR
ncbi:serine/threonine-protein kinase [Streptomyces sp. NPDC090108]|uniref:serine/threonine-protein kinase n=1 Tax=Streptomyces sp. NPDC090108 TaxID=3365947 RepID=UPI0037F62F22